MIRKRVAQCSAFAVHVPLPLMGRGRGGGREATHICRRLRLPLPTPTPPSPQGGGRRIRRLAPAWLKAAVHAGFSQRRAWAGGVAFAGNGFDTRAHFVEVRLARCAASRIGAGAVRGDFVVECDAHFVERGFVRARGPTPTRSTRRPSPCRGG